MTTRLLIRLGETWPTPSAAPWVLLGADGQAQSEGESEPRHWPAADECVVILGGAQCLWLETALPKAARRDTGRLLAYALEDRLLSDPDSQHLTISHRRPADDGDGLRLGVLVLGRDRLRQVLAQLAAIGRAPIHLYSELQCAPAGAQQWHISVSGPSAILRTGPEDASAVDTVVLGALLEQQLAAARAANNLPDSLLLHLEPGCPAPDLSTLHDSEVKLATAPAYRWWQGVSVASDLLHGEFAVAGGTAARLARYRLPLVVASLALGVWLLANVGEAWWLRHQLNDLQARMVRVYSSNFPNSPALAPLAQMRQQLDLERNRHGRLASNDALALMAVVAEVLGPEAAGQIQSVRFADGLLDLGLASGLAEKAASAKAQLAGRDLLAEIRNEGGLVHLLVRPEISP